MIDVNGKKEPHFNYGPSRYELSSIPIFTRNINTSKDNENKENKMKIVEGKKKYDSQRK